MDRKLNINKKNENEIRLTKKKLKKTNNIGLKNGTKIKCRWQFKGECAKLEDKGKLIKSLLPLNLSFFKPIIDFLTSFFEHMHVRKKQKIDSDIMQK